MLFGDVIDRKFHPDNNGSSLCSGNDPLRKGRWSQECDSTVRHDMFPYHMLHATATEYHCTHSPQPSGALGLVDVDEVGHHASLEQTALCLHSDLK